MLSSRGGYGFEIEAESSVAFVFRRVRPFQVQSSTNWAIRILMRCRITMISPFHDRRLGQHLHQGPEMNDTEM